MVCFSGVPGEVHYSHPNQYNINSDLDEDEIDAIPYGEFKNSKGVSSLCNKKGTS